MKRWLSGALVLVATVASAELKDVSAFGRIPIQSGGRVMPMDSFARIQLLDIAGRSSVKGQSATEWLAQLLFHPHAAHTQAVFLVNNPEVLEAVEIRATGERARYSFSQLEPGLDGIRAKAQRAAEREDKDRTPFEREIVRLHHAINAYIGLSYGLIFTQPHPDFAVTNQAVRTLLELPATQADFSFLDIYLRASRAAPVIQEITAKPQSEWSADQHAIYELSQTLYSWGQNLAGLPLNILPANAAPGQPWLSPGDVLAQGLQDEAVRSAVVALDRMAKAYRTDDATAFNQAASDIAKVTTQRGQGERGVRWLDFEIFQNRADFFTWSKFFYGFGFLASLIAILIGDPVRRRKAIMVAVLCISAALIPHTAGIVARMVIMGRPPVTTLFSTFVFVGWVCALLGLVLEFFQRNALGSLVASLSGLALLLLSMKFNDSGDGMGVMIAVLDSNFWLATHVVTVTIGYAGCVAAGLVGHIYLIKAALRSTTDTALKSIARAIYGLLAFGLVFAFLGTMLGGVWADQSWGRFWGWDPKENGALLIVLWCAILFHARIAGWIRDLGMAVGSVLGVIVVLAAWMGVNLLGVGLHSYGFTNELRTGFYVGVAIEVVFAAAFLAVNKLTSAGTARRNSP